MDYDKLEFQPTQDELRNIREWLEKIPYLPVLEDHILASFFRGCKGSLEKTKRCIDNFYQNRLKYPEIITNFNPLSKETQQFMDTAKILPLPKKTKDGCTIITSALTKTDAESFNPAEMFKMFCLVLAVLIYDNEIGSAKVIFALNAKGINLKHLAKMTPTLIASAISLLATSAPIRIEAIHILHPPPGSEWLLSFAQSLIKEKLALRIHLQDDAKNLCDLYPKELIPSDYGGELDSLNELFKSYRKKLEGAAQLFLDEEETLKKLDALRPKSDEIFVGSFKKLDID